MILGRKLIVAIDGVAAAGAKSCNFGMSQDFIKACSPANGRVLTKIPTTYEWSLSCDCLVPNSIFANRAVDMIKEGTKCFVTFTDGQGFRRCGDAYIKSCDYAGSVGSLATFKVTFEPSGPLQTYLAPEPEPFTEGNGIELTAQGDSDFSLDESETLNTYGVGFTTTKTANVTVKARSANWAFINIPFDADTKEAVGHADTQPFDEKSKITGTGNKTFQLTAGTYTILMTNQYLQQPFRVFVVME
jgi:hypothetical protein